MVSADNDAAARDSFHGGADSRQRSVAVQAHPVSVGRQARELGRTAPQLHTSRITIEAVTDAREPYSDIERTDAIRELVAIFDNFVLVKAELRFPPETTYLYTSCCWREDNIVEANHPARSK